MIKNSPASAGDTVQSLGRGDPLEEEMATSSSILAWEIPRTEEPGGLQFIGCKELDMTEHARILRAIEQKHKLRKAFFLI